MHTDETKSRGDQDFDTYVLVVHKIKPNVFFQNHDKMPSFKFITKHQF